MRLFALSLVLVASVHAQDAVVLTPGHPDLDLAAVRPRSGVVAVQMLAPQSQLLGTVRDDVQLDGDVLTVVTSTAVPMAGAPVRDSTQMSWPSLTPLAHRVDVDDQSGEVVYRPGGVSGVWGPLSAPAEVSFDVERPVFAPAALPYVIRALPLDQTGYQAVVPLFSTKDRFQDARLTVVGPETVTLADSQTVQAVAVDQVGGGGVARGFTQRHFLDPATREIVQTTLAPMGMSIQIEPMAASLAATVRPIRARSAEAPAALVPGHPDLALDQLALGAVTQEMRWALPEPRPLWTISETETRGDDGTLTVVLTADNVEGTQTIRDTTRVAWPSLAPMSHRNVLAKDTGDNVATLTFDGLHVTGAYGNDGAAPLPLDLELSEPVFGPRSVPLIVRALPFRAGYTATLTEFTASDRLTVIALTVLGRENVETPRGTVSAWIVEQVRDGRTRYYAIDPDTRDLLSTWYSPTPGSLVETVLL